MLKNLDNKSRILVLAIALALVVGLSNFMITGNVSKSYIDRGHYFSQSGESQCSKVGGMPYSVGGQGKLYRNKLVKLHSISKDVSLISVDGAKRAMEPGAEKYVAGVYVTLFATGDNDACLIVRNWQ